MSIESAARLKLSDELADNREALERLERTRDKLLSERRRLAVGLLTLGESERAVASIAGVSGPAVHQWGAVR